MVTDLLPEEPGLPAVSVCDAANTYVPSEDTGVSRVSVQLPEEEQGTNGGVVGFPPRVTLTGLPPGSHEPPTEVTFALVL